MRCTQLTAGAILRSTDGGNTWTVVLGTQDMTVSNLSVYTDVAVSPTGVVYATLGAGVGQGIWRSTNGTSWQSITPNNWPSTGYVMIGIAPSNENVVYFFAYAPGYGVNDGMLMKWNGTTWTDLSTNLPKTSGTDNLDLQTGYNMVIKVWPQNENTVFLGDVNLWRSTDGFSSANNRVQIGGYSTDNAVNLYPNHHPDQHAAFFLPSNPNIMFTGSDGGVSKTNNCIAHTVQWVYLNNGLYTSQFYYASFDHASSSSFLIGGMQDWGTYGTITTNLSTPWKELFAGDGCMCYVADNNTFIYGSSELGNILIGYTAADGSLSNWSVLTPSTATNFRFVTPYVMDPNNNKMIYVGAGGSIWRNSNVTQIPLKNNSATSINYTLMSNATLTSGNISAFGISKTPANILYYGTDTGKVFRIDNANSGNPSPHDVWTGKGFPSNAYVNCITVDPKDSKKALVIFSNYEVKSIFYTTDSGGNWATVSGNLEENADGSGAGPSVRWVTILHPSTVGHPVYFIGTSTGVYSTDSLQGDLTVWTQESPDLIGNMVVDELDSRETDNLVLAATHGGGVFSTSVAAPVIQPPSNFTISDYPNDNGHQLQLHWAVSPSEIDGLVSGYKIFRSRNSTLSSPIPITNFASWDSIKYYEQFYTIFIDSVSAGTTEYVDSVPLNDTVYYYWIQAVGPTGASKMAVPGIPTYVKSVPIEFALGNSYPNPFNPSTTIDFEIPVDSRVVLKIYNLAGQEVATLKNETMSAGKHSITWDAKGMPSGVYFYKLTSGGQSETKKMLLLK